MSLPVAMRARDSKLETLPMAQHDPHEDCAFWPVFSSIKGSWKLLSSDHVPNFWLLILLIAWEESTQEGLHVLKFLELLWDCCLPGMVTGMDLGHDVLESLLVLQVEGLVLVLKSSQSTAAATGRNARPTFTTHTRSNWSIALQQS